MHPLLRLSQYIWTQHAKAKMAYYGLSESRVKRVLRAAVRVEEGIAPHTIACMQPSSTKSKAGVKTWTQEIWVMAQTDKTGHIHIISAWRYPGMSKSRASLPDEVKLEIEEALETGI
ncbi:MAG: hypothetical protein WC099_02805 [Candidatus Paceibacterota bacterium]